MTSLTWTQSADKPRATILICHGFAEHQGRYRSLANFFADAGYDTITYDLPGHGMTEGTRAQVDVGALIMQHRAVRREVLADMRRRARVAPLFVLGHSMGGLITVASAILDPDNLAGVVLTGAGFVTKPRVPRAAAAALSRLAGVAPSLPTITLDSAAISRDPDVVMDYDADPLNYRGAIPMLTLGTLVHQGLRTLSEAKRWAVDLPLLVVHGEADAIVDADGSRGFAEEAWKAGARDLDFQLIPGAYHEVLNELESQKLMEDIRDWIAART